MGLPVAPWLQVSQVVAAEEARVHVQVHAGKLVSELSNLGILCFQGWVVSELGAKF